MLTNSYKPVSLSILSTDLALCSTVETYATVYHREGDRFHLSLKEPGVEEWEVEGEQVVLQPTAPKLIWLEISSFRTILTAQGSGKASYRHLWQQGTYGISRYWLNKGSALGQDSFRLRNYTRSIFWGGQPLPELLRIEYELWTEQVQLGRYLLNLEIYH